MASLQSAKTHCPQGHEYTGANTYICKRGKRMCKECGRQRERDKKGHQALKPLAERFWAKVSKGDGCWHWTGCKNHFGYGAIKVDGKMIGAHRFSYQLANGEIGPALFVCHRCDNPGCVNPAHLFLGTARDNNLDREAKGRGAQQQVTHCPKGHPYDEANTYVHKSGKRDCRTCRSIATKAYQQRKKGTIS